MSLIRGIVLNEIGGKLFFEIASRTPLRELEHVGGRHERDRAAVDGQTCGHRIVPAGATFLK